MLKLYDNPFSPFARKVRMALKYKDLPFESIDSLALARQADLERVNPRAEVPVLDDDGFVVVNSADIVSYVEQLQPDPPLFPQDLQGRATARAWERRCDGVIDAIVHDISLWTWPTHHRDDMPPPGLIESGCADIRKIMNEFETALPADGFLCGDLSIGDLAMFPHASAMRLLGVDLAPAAFPKLHSWNRRMRSLDVVRDDLDSVKRMAAEKFGSVPSPYEGRKVVWRGDRIEWLFARGFHDWWFEELRAGRVVVPNPA